MCLLPVDFLLSRLFASPAPVMCITASGCAGATIALVDDSRGLPHGVFQCPRDTTRLHPLIASLGLCLLPRTETARGSVSTGVPYETRDCSLRLHCTAPVRVAAACHRRSGDGAGHHRAALKGAPMSTVQPCLGPSAACLEACPFEIVIDAQEPAPAALCAPTDECVDCESCIEACSILAMKLLRAQ